MTDESQVLQLLLRLQCIFNKFSTQNCLQRECFPKSMRSDLYSAHKVLLIWMQLLLVKWQKIASTWNCMARLLLAQLVTPTWITLCHIPDLTLHCSKNTQTISMNQHSLLVIKLLLLSCLWGLTYCCHHNSKRKTTPGWFFNVFMPMNVLMKMKSTLHKRVDACVRCWGSLPTNLHFDPYHYLFGFFLFYFCVLNVLRQLTFHNTHI